MRSIKVIILFFLTLCVTVVVHAQVQESALKLPDIVVDKILINNQDVDAIGVGSVVTGTYRIRNQSSFDAPEILVKVSLVSNYINGQRTSVIDEQLQKPIFILAGKSQTLPFSYTIPKAVSGTKLSIRVRAFMKSGLPLGWSDFPVSINDAVGLLSIDKILVVVDDRGYMDQEGPTITKPQTVRYLVELSNPLSESVQVTPHISVYERSSVGPLLKEYSESAFTLSAKGKKQVVYDLPLFDYKPGVYAGTVSFVDSNGVKRTTSATFRYIVGGEIAMIQSVSVDKSNVKAGDVVKLSVAITGTPDNIDASIATSSDTLHAKVELLNENGKKIGSTETDLNIVKNGTFVIPVTVTDSAKAIKSTVTISKNGVILSTSSLALSSDFAQKASEVKKPDNTNILTYLAGFVALIVLGLLFIFFRRKKMTGRIIFFVGICLISMALANKSSAATFSSGSATLLINSPVDGQIMAPGEQFTISGSESTSNCANNSPTFTIGVDFNGTHTSYTQARTNGINSTTHEGNNSRGETNDFIISTPSDYVAAEANHHYVCDFIGTFPIYCSHDAIAGIREPKTPVIFTAPTTPGTYTIHFTLTSGDSSVSGDQTIVVLDLPIVSISANPATVGFDDPANTSTITWSATKATSCTSSGFTVNGSSNNIPFSGSVVDSFPDTRNVSITCVGADNYPVTASARVKVRPVGYLNNIRCDGHFSGWSCYPPTTALLSIKLYSDSTLIKTVSTGAYHQSDTNALCGLDPTNNIANAFNSSTTQVRDALMDGLPHVIKAYAVNPTDSTKRSLLKTPGGGTSFTLTCTSQYSCTGTRPANTQVCNQDEVGLSANTAWTQVSDINSCTSRKCEYYPAAPTASAPTLSFSASPASPGPNPFTLNWSLTSIPVAKAQEGIWSKVLGFIFGKNAEAQIVTSSADGHTCTASGSWTGNKTIEYGTGANESMAAVTGLPQTLTYTLTCAPGHAGDWGVGVTQVSKTITVDVGGMVSPLSCTTADGYTIPNQDPFTEGQYLYAATGCDYAWMSCVNGSFQYVNNPPTDPRWLAFRYLYNPDPGSCPTYSCSPTTIPNATICSGDGSGLSANTSSAVVDPPCVSNSIKCEFVCDTNFHKSGNACVPDVTPTPLNCKVSSPTTTFANVGQLVTWNVTGGTGPYTWGGSGFSGSQPTGDTYSTRYSAIGPKVVSVYDSTGVSSQVTCETNTTPTRDYLLIINDPNFHEF